MSCFGLFKKKSTNKFIDKFIKQKTLSNASSCQDLNVSHFVVENSDVTYFDEDNFSSKMANYHPIVCKTQTENMHLEFNPSKMRLFLDQNIDLIRLDLDENRKFDDEKFFRDVSSIVEDIDSGLGLSLSTRFKTKQLDKLDTLIKWQRTKVFKMI
jgi:hypothetical protein